MSRPLPILLLAVLLGCGGARADTPPDLATQVLQRLAQVGSRRASFHEEKRLAALTTVLRSSGVLTYVQPGYLEKQTLEPKPERLIIDGNRLTILEGSAAPRQLDIDSHPALRVMVDSIRAPLAGDVGVLRQDYAVHAAGDPGAWTLTLLPARPEVARSVQSLVLEGVNNTIRTIRLVSRNGDEQVTTIDPTP